jgi:hypothetical protein
MQFSRRNQRAMLHRSRSRLYRVSALVFAAFLIVGCSAQPITVEQELAAAGVAGAIGAGSGAVFAYGSGKSYPVSILIGAAGMAGVVLLYEEIRREAGQTYTPNTPSDANAPASSNPYP